MMAKKKKKLSGHYCKICGDRKPNEKFSGKGHAQHICSQCWSLPKETQADMMRCNDVDRLIFKFSFSRKDWELLEKYAQRYKDQKSGQLAQSILDDRRGNSIIVSDDEDEEYCMEAIDLLPRMPIKFAELDKEDKAWLKDYIREEVTDYLIHINRAPVDNDLTNIKTRVMIAFKDEFFASLKDDDQFNQFLRNSIASLSKELQEKFKEAPF